MGNGPSVLVGRRRELASLQDVVAHQQNALLMGPAGVGKSRLLDELRTSVGAEAVTIAISGGDAASSIPLAPLLKLVPPGSTEPARAILSEFYRRSMDRSTVMLVDDAHALDEASAALVHQLCGAEGISVIAALRPGESQPSQIEAIWRDGLATDIALAPLDRAGSDRLVQELLGPAARAVRGHVWARCRGHPLFIRELLDSARRSGDLAFVDGQWELLSEPELPSRLRDLLLRRLSELSVSERRLLALVSVGGSLAEEAVPVLGLAKEGRALRDRALLVRYGPRLAPSHPLYGELVLHELSTKAQNSLRRDLANALESIGEAEAVHVAMLRLDAGEPLRAKELVPALETAIAAYHSDLAGRLVAALDEGRTNSYTEMLRMQALAMQGQWSEAELAFRRARERMRGGDDGRLMAEWARLNFEFRADPTDVVAWARNALKTPGVSPAAAELLELALIRAQMFSGSMAQTVADVGSFLAVPRSPAAVERARFDLGTALGHLGRLREACEVLESCLHEPAELPPIELTRVRATFTMYSAWRDGPSAAAARGVAAVQRARAEGEPEDELLARITLAAALHDGGRHGEAAYVTHRLASLRAFLVQQRIAALADGIRASSLSMLAGRSGDAEEYLAMIPQPWEGPYWVSGPLLWLARARLDRARGASPLPALEAGLDHARRRACGLHELQLLRERAHFGRVADVTSRVRELVEMSDTPLASMIGREIEALARRDAQSLGDVALAAARFEAAGIGLEAAEAAASIHIQRQKYREAARNLALVRHLSQAVPGMHVLRRGVRAILTDRERDVVDRVVAGASNRDVADELHLSVRTVERHLYRVFKRLDVDGRGELRELLRGDIESLPAIVPVEV